MRRRSAHVVNALGSLAVPAAALAAAPLLARGLGADDRGLFAGDQALVVVASSWIGLGAADAAATAWASWSRRARVVVTLAVLAGAVLPPLTAVVARIVAGGRPWGAEAAVLVLGAGVTGLAVLARGRAVGEGRLALVGADKLLTSGLRLAVTAAATATGQLTLLTALVALVLPQVAGLALLTVGTARTPSGAPGATGGPRRPPRVGPGRLVAWNALASTAGVLLVHGDQLVLLPLIGAEQLGLFTVAVTLAELPTVAVKPFRDAVLARGGDVSRALLLRAVAVQGAVATGCAATWGWAVPVLFGPAFSPALPACYVMILAGVVKALEYLANGVLAALGRPRVRALAAYAGAAVGLGAVLPLSVHGALGAAVAASLGYAVTLAVETTVLVPSRRRRGRHRG